MSLSVGVVVQHFRSRCPCSGVWHLTAAISSIVSRRHRRRHIPILVLFFYVVVVDVLHEKVLDACEFMGNGTLLASPRCENNGNCVNGSMSDSPGSFVCVCATGYTGQHCQQSMTVFLHIFISDNSLIINQ